MYVYRLSTAPYAHRLDGEGARLFGGRWNSIGHPALYTSPSLSTCVLEVRVHTATIPAGYQQVTIEVPDDASIITLDSTTLPLDWRLAGHPACERAGQAWLQAATHLCLQVPSAIVPVEANLILNPAHPDMARIKVVDIAPFDFDPRLYS